MESRTKEHKVREASGSATESEAPGLIIQVDEVPVARERCAAVGKNGNNRAELSMS